MGTPLFDSLVNCIILAVGLRGIFAVPAKIDDQFRSSTDATPIREHVASEAKCPCNGNASATLDWPARDHQWDQLRTRNVMVHGMVCSCNLGMRAALARDDYRHTPGIGSHKLHTRAATWNVARKLCIEEGGHLAIVNSFAEAHILMDIFNRSGPVKGAVYPDEAFLGVHDLFSEGDWVTVLGDSLAKTGYTAWSDKWGGQPDNGGGRQNCGAFMKEGGMDDVACDVPFPFFCEQPTMQLL
ncbi:hemolymph lipopolysaccharide-binding protein-like [Hylaeus anthracinus]|uniref:hemolymph lipopolysaccharide-binding protein-like n=1 Tax=Hylaeus anthracinus TaxID=313031 RepID=UPI0023B918A3|nr:hemolymph lipopolysaccharide-binding protein-like [Hylaeus anthracinus]